MRSKIKLTAIPSLSSWRENIVWGPWEFFHFFLRCCVEKHVEAISWISIATREDSSRLKMWKRNLSSIEMGHQCIYLIPLVKNHWIERSSLTLCYQNGKYFHSDGRTWSSRISEWFGFVKIRSSIWFNPWIGAFLSMLHGCELVKKEYALMTDLKW